MVESIPASPEITPETAIAAYLQEGPVRFGDISPDQLNAWLAACENEAQLDALGRLCKGYMHLDWAHAAFLELSEDGKMPPPKACAPAVAHIEQARRVFTNLIDDPEASVPLQVEAQLARGSLCLHKPLVGGPTNALEKEQLDYHLDIISAGSKLLSYYLQHPDIQEDRDLLNTTTVLWLFSHASTRFSGMPSSPRHRQAGDVPPWHIWVLESTARSSYLCKLRFGEGPSNDEALIVSDHMLSHHRYSCDHAYGTLQALTNQAVLFARGDQNVGAQVDNELIKMHIATAWRGLEAAIAAQSGPPSVEAATADSAEAIISPLQWYQQLGPEDSPVATDAERFDQLLSSIAALGSSDSDDLFTLGSMHLDRAVSQTAGTTPSNHYFRSAEESFRDAAEAADPAYPSRWLKAVFYAASSLMHEAVFTQHPYIEATAERYCSVLREIGQEILKLPRAKIAKHDKQEIQRIDQLAHRITAALLITDDPTKSFIALASVPRQRGILSGQRNKGWDLTALRNSDPQDWHSSLDQEHPARLRLAANRSQAGSDPAARIQVITSETLADTGSLRHRALAFHLQKVAGKTLSEKQHRTLDQVSTNLMHFAATSIDAALLRPG